MNKLWIAILLGLSLAVFGAMGGTCDDDDDDDTTVTTTSTSTTTTTSTKTAKTLTLNNPTANILFFGLAKSSKAAAVGTATTTADMYTTFGGVSFPVTINGGSAQSVTLELTQDEIDLLDGGKVFAGWIADTNTDGDFDAGTDLWGQNADASTLDVQDSPSSSVDVEITGCDTDYDNA